MPKTPIPCPACKVGHVKVDRSGKLLMDDRTGLLVRECWVRCTGCLRRGKALLTLDIAMFPDDSVLAIEPTPFPKSAAA